MITNYKIVLHVHFDKLDINDTLKRYQRHLYARKFVRNLM